MVATAPASDSCGAPRAEALDRSYPPTPAAARVPGVTMVNLTDMICQPNWCGAVVGSVVVYRDTSSHLTKTFALTLAPYLDRAIADVSPAAS